MTGVRLVALQVVGICGVTLVLLEVLVATAFMAPRLSPLPLSLSRYLYVRMDRNVIQVMPQCARFDPYLTYTLKPGRCVFANREFANEYLINSVGLRDDEQSLDGPEIIVLGDSVTMGWGVDQSEAFPEVVQARTKRRTLNAGVSSYGTVRELRLLERLDRSKLRHVVIQYSDNDASENEKFVESTGFSTMDAAAYERTVRTQEAELRYFPGKYALNLLAQFKNIVGRAGSPGLGPAPGLDAIRQAELFVSVLERSPVDLSGYEVYVLATEPAFVRQCRDRMARSGVQWVRGVVFVDASNVASLQGAYFVLDDHPTAVGHQAIAGELLTALSRTP